MTVSTSITPAQQLSALAGALACSLLLLAGTLAIFAVQGAGVV